MTAIHKPILTMTQKPKNYYRIIVDTDTYTGNFERQMIAYATSLTGECGVGEHLAELAREQLPASVVEFWENHGVHLPDDHGCHRPARIYPTPGFFNHGMGAEFPTTDEGRAQGLVDYKKRFREYVQDQLARLEFVTIGQGGWTQEAIEREQFQLNEKLRGVEEMTAPNEYPAYKSVAVDCDTMPTEEVMMYFIARAQEFVATQYGKPLRITDIVLEQDEVHTTTQRTSIIDSGSKPRRSAP